MIALLLCANAFGAYERALWSPGDAPTNHTTTPFLQDSTEVRIHDVDSDTWRYNMGPAIIGHSGTMHCIWKSTPGDETSTNAVTRYSYSTNDGFTWSTPQIIANDSGPGWYGHGTLFVVSNIVYALLPHEYSDSYDTELWRLNGSTWSLIGKIRDDFYPQENPKLMPNGNWICGGFERQGTTTYSAVIISQGSNITSTWTLKRIDAYQSRGFETSTWIDGAEVTACTRQWKKDAAGVLRMGSLVSIDSGNSWNPGYIINYPASNFPFVDAHVYADHVSNGERYLVYNMPVSGVYNNRRVLAIAFAEPGSRVLSSIYKLRDHGDTEPHYPGIAKDPGWMQANGCEYNGNIYIVYVRAKEDVDMTIIPVDDGGGSPISGEHYLRCNNGNQYLHNDGSTSGSEVTTYYYRPDWASEKWNIEHVAGDVYRLKSLRGTNLYLTATGSGAMSPIVAQTYNPSSDYQKWEFVHMGGNDYRLKIVLANQYMNDQSNEVLDDLFLYHDRPTWTSQIWTLEEVQ